MGSFKNLNDVKLILQDGHPFHKLLISKSQTLHFLIYFPYGLLFLLDVLLELFKYSLLPVGLTLRELQTCSDEFLACSSMTAFLKTPTCDLIWTVKLKTM
jgi:hypothetical protein